MSFLIHNMCLQGLITTFHSEHVFAYMQVWDRHRIDGITRAYRPPGVSGPLVPAMGYRLCWPCNSWKVRSTGLQQCSMCHSWICEDSRMPALACVHAHAHMHVCMCMQAVCWQDCAARQAGVYHGRLLCDDNCRWNHIIRNMYELHDYHVGTYGWAAYDLQI